MQGAQLTKLLERPSDEAGLRVLCNGAFLAVVSRLLGTPGGRYYSYANSARACFSFEMSGSPSFQRSKKLP